MRKILLLLILPLAVLNIYSQCPDCHMGKHDDADFAQFKANHKYLKSLHPDSSGGLAQSYILQNVCGLNWQQSSVLVTTRYSPTPGTGLPTSVPLTFSNCNVDSVLKAYLYFNGSYFTAYAANPATVSITNPALVVNTYSADSIGTGPNKCWGETGTIAYRVDVTNCISGGGNYGINITGTGITGQAIDGTTLLIVYIDKSASYSGSIVLWDGLYTNSSGSPKSQTFTGFNVCNATPTGQAFSIMADMQSNVNGGINTETYNGSTQQFSNLFYNFCSITTPLTAAQNSTTYTVYADDGGDCYSWVLAGLYWQNTTCMTCTPTVLATQTMTITPPIDTICQGDSIQLFASGDSSYIWAPATGLSCTNCPDPMASPNATTTYSVTGFNGCLIAKDTVQVFVNPRVTLTISPGVQVCSGDSVQLLVSGGDNYVWHPSTLLSCDSCANPIATPTATTTYWVVSGTLGCKDSASVTITIVTSPTVSVVPMSPKICEGNSVVLTASGANGYRWTPTSSLSCNTCASPTASPTVTTVYRIIGGQLGCRDTVYDTVFVGPPVVAGITPASDSICQGDTIQLIGLGGGTYAWSNGQTHDSIKVTPSSTVTYTLIVSNGACSDTTSATINIKPLTTATIRAFNDTVCPGGITTISLTAAGGQIAYHWSNGATTSSISVSSLTSTTYTAMVYGRCDSVKFIQPVTVIPLATPVITGAAWRCAGTHDTLTVTGGDTYKWSSGKTTTTYITGAIRADSTIKVYAYNSLGCIDSSSFLILLRNAPVVTISPSAIACAGTPADIVATATGSNGPFTFSWVWSTGQTSTSISASKDTIFLLSPDSTIVITVTASNGCTSRAVNTTVTPNAPYIFACCNKTILIGDDTIIVAHGDSIKSYSWSPAGEVTCLNPPCDSVRVTPTVTTTYTVTATDSIGCQTERLVTITVETPCFNFAVPNVFTPDFAGTQGINGGVNNLFYIQTTNINGWSIDIFDRWGKEVFKSSNPTDYWNGNTEGGGKAPDGVYYYIITATCQNTSYKKDGFLQLIR